MVAFKSINKVVDFLQNPSNPLYQSLPDSPIPGTNLAYEARPTPGGGEFTGNIIAVPERKEESFFGGLARDLLSFVSLSPQGIAMNVAEQGIRQSISNEFGQTSSGPIVGRLPMGFFDDIFGGSDSSETSFSAGLAPDPGINWGNLLNTGANIVGSFFAPQSQGVPPMIQSNLAMLPSVVRGGSMVVRGAGAALSARLASIGLNRATAWTLLKQQGPTALLALGLTAVEVGQLARSRGGHRRMNMCNGRALRRASRRLEGFHKFYKRTCGLPVRRSKSRSCK